MKEILIVEDSEDVAKLLGSMLGDRYRIRHVESGKDAIESYRERRADLITLDLVMPDMKGTDVIKELLKADPSAKILVVSVLDLQEIVSEALGAGALDYLVKPFSAKKLREKVDKLL